MRFCSEGEGRRRSDYQQRSICATTWDRPARQQGFYDIYFSFSTHPIPTSLLINPSPPPTSSSCSLLFFVVAVIQGTLSAHYLAIPSTPFVLPVSRAVVAILMIVVVCRRSTGEVKGHHYVGCVESTSSSVSLLNITLTLLPLELIPALISARISTTMHAHNLNLARLILAWSNWTSEPRSGNSLGLCRDTSALS